MSDIFEEVHVKLENGTTVYWPKGDISRLAPAAVCSIASRIVRLRKAIKADPFDMREVERLINEPIAFEHQFLSGKSIDVHNTIKELGSIEAKDARIAELEAALRDLFEEYDDRASQFGSDYLWQKHEDSDFVARVRQKLTPTPPKP